MLRAARVPLLSVLVVLGACSAAPSVDPGGAAATSTDLAAGPPRYVSLSARELAAAAPAARALAPSALAAARELVLRDPDAFVLVDRSAGRLVHATGRLSDASSAPDAEILSAFTRRHAEALELDDPDRQLVAERAPTRFQGARSYRLRQVVEGVPVMRRSVKLEIGPDGAVRTWSGVTTRDLGALPGLAPSIAAERALEVAKAHLAARRPDVTSTHEYAPELMLMPGEAGQAARLIWRVGVLAAVSGAEGRQLRGLLVSLDAHDGSLLGVADTTHSCTDGAAGTVVTSSETVRAALTATAPVARSLTTCHSTWDGDYYLEDHSHSAVLYCYDATSYTDPSKASTWFSACKEPACYTVSSASNDWQSGAPAYQASDYRIAQKVLAFYRNRFGREGADGNGENLVLESGMNYDNATSIGMARSIAIGKPDYAKGKPSYGVLDVLAHELTHTVSWHEWVGIFDYGIEGSVHGVEGAMDEHLSDMFGAMASYHDADEA